MTDILLEQITFCWNKLLSSACFSDFFGLNNGKRNAFSFACHTDTYEAFNLFALDLYFSFHCDVHWKKKPKQTSLPRPINVATKLSLPNDGKTDLSVLWHTENCNFVVDYNELVSTQKSAIAIIIY